MTIQCDNLIGNDVDFGKNCSSVFSSLEVAIAKILYPPQKIQVCRKFWHIGRKGKSHTNVGFKTDIFGITVPEHPYRQQAISW